jgi:glucan biosynthesis protein C
LVAGGGLDASAVPPAADAADVQAPRTVARYHYMDAARGILMTLGIVYHAARVYGETGWIISDPETSSMFDGIALAVHRFRMPAFFLMSGLFAALTLRKYGPRFFLRRRVPRIVIPFVTVLFTLNVVQLYVVRAYNGTDLTATAIFAGNPWRGVPIDSWISHLWFLVCLAYYFVATALIALAADGRRAPFARARTRLAPIAGRPVACLVLLPLGNVAIAVLFGLFHGLYALRPLIDFDVVADYVPFFATGLLVFVSPRLYESLTRFGASVVALTVAVGLVRIAGVNPASGAGARLLEAYLGFLWTWIAVYWVLVCFRTVLDRPSPAATRLADASYTIYLFHQLTLILIAWSLVNVRLAIGLKFTIVMAATFAVTVVVHLVVIRPVRILTLLFNGRWPENHAGRRPSSVARKPRRQVVGTG